MSTVVPRTCTEMRCENQQIRPEPPRPLEDFRDACAYVLLGDPGSGKTTAFELECDALGDSACLVTARNFLTFNENGHPEWSQKTLFIDGLDEIRAGESNAIAPFDQIRQRLERLRPRHLRLSCRAADWLGSNDQEHLEQVVPGGEVTVLSLDQLSDSNIEQILDSYEGIDIRHFIEEAKRQGIEELLRNPLTLDMLAKTIAPGGNWPKSRLEVFEKACLQIAREHNEGHVHAVPEQDLSRLLEAAGRLSAIQLISDISGYARHANQATADCPAISQCGGNADQAKQAVKTKLFTNVGDCVAPIHRHIAEFVGAKHLSQIISDGLPARRVLSLMTGQDGLVVTKLRGLSAWLAAQSPDARADLIERDPVGVGLYGDISRFSAGDKRALLSSLRSQSHLHTLPRSGIAFRALASPPMESEINRILVARSREDRDQAFTAFILSILPYGQALPGLCEILREMIRDHTRWSGIHTLALDAFIHCADPGKSTKELIALLADIRLGIISDPDFQLRGTLLAELYPESLPFPEVFDHLTPGGSSFLIGRYTRFWATSLCDKTPDDQISGLLDSFVGRFDDLCPALETHRLWNLPTNLLTRTLRTYGDQLDARRLYDWLGINLSTRPRDSEQYDFIRSWLERHPALQKAIVQEGLRQHPNSEVFEIYQALGQRFHGSEMPPDFGIWCLSEALSTATPGSPAERYLLEQAVRAQRNQVSDTGLSLAALEEHAKTNETLKQLLALPPSAQTLLSSGRKMPDQMEDKLLSHVRANETELRENCANPNLLFHMAHVYLDQFFSGEGGNPQAIQERLQGDAALADFALQGLRQVIERKDIPSVEKILALREENKTSLFSMPFLAALAEIERTEPKNWIQWDDDRIRKALLFYYATPHGNYRPRWYDNLLETRPEIVADMQIRFAVSELQEDREHMYKLWELAHDKAHSRVAKLVCLPLLHAFPARCKKGQLKTLAHLLWAAIQYAETNEFLKLIEKKTSQASAIIAQQVYWLATGSIILPEEYGKPLQDFVLDKQSRIEHFAEFLRLDDRLATGLDRLAVPTSEVVVRLVGRYAIPDHMFPKESGPVIAQMQTSNLVYQHIRSLAASPTHSAGTTLDKLRDDPALSAWRDILIQAVEEQRVLCRDMEYHPPSIDQICQTLGGATPANVADLWALLTDRLDEIGMRISYSRADGWRQYWNEDEHGRPTSPKHENSCRDAILDNLARHLPQGVDPQPEGQYSRDKRADIRVSYQGFNVPIEIKKNKHPKLWRSAKDQLIKQYVNSPGADGYGIYLVLWFGKDQTQPPPSGPRPADSESLRQQLCSTLSESEARKISVCVIDVSKEGPHGIESDAWHGFPKKEEESRAIE